MTCSKCKSDKVDDGTSHGSTYDFFCRNCGNRFDIAEEGCTCDKPNLRCPIHDTAFEEGEI